MGGKKRRENFCHQEDYSILAGNKPARPPAGGLTLSNLLSAIPTRRRKIPDIFIILIASYGSSSCLFFEPDQQLTITSSSPKTMLKQNSKKHRRKSNKNSFKNAASLTKRRKITYTPPASLSKPSLRKFFSLSYQLSQYKYQPHSPL